MNNGRFSHQPSAIWIFTTKLEENFTIKRNSLHTELFQLNLLLLFLSLDVLNIICKSVGKKKQPTNNHNKQICIISMEMFIGLRAKYVSMFIYLKNSKRWRLTEWFNKDTPNSHERFTAYIICVIHEAVYQLRRNKYARCGRIMKQLNGTTKNKKRRQLKIIFHVDQ